MPSVVMRTRSPRRRGRSGALSISRWACSSSLRRRIADCKSLPDVLDRLPGALGLPALRVGAAHFGQHVVELVLGALDQRPRFLLRLLPGLAAQRLQRRQLVVVAAAQHLGLDAGALGLAGVGDGLPAAFLQLAQQVGGVVGAGQRRGGRRSGPTAGMPRRPAMAKALDEPGMPCSSRYVGASVASSNSTLAFCTPSVVKA